MEIKCPKICCKIVASKRSFCGYGYIDINIAYELQGIDLLHLVLTILYCYIRLHTVL